MTIGQRIKTRREELNLSQDELAKKLGYKSRSSLNKIELDQRDLPQTKIKAIADALNTTPAYIMGWENDIEEVSQNACTYEEIAIIQRFRNLSWEGQKYILQQLDFAEGIYKKSDILSTEKIG